MTLACALTPSTGRDEEHQPALLIPDLDYVTSPTQDAHASPFMIENVIIEPDSGEKQVWCSVLGRQRVSIAQLPLHAAFAEPVQAVSPHSHSALLTFSEE